MEDYTLYIYSEEKGSYYYEDEGTFIEDIINYTDNKVSYTIHIVKEHARDSVHNDENIEKYLEEEFTKLMALYKFMSWHPQDNNYIGL